MLVISQIVVEHNFSEHICTKSLLAYCDFEECKHRLTFTAVGNTKVNDQSLFYWLS